MGDESLNPTPEKSVLTERQQFWFDHLQACDASGNSVAQYAKEHDLSVTSLYQRRQEFRKRGLLPAPSCKVPSFATIRMTSDLASEDALRICFPNGVRIEWPMPRGEEAASLLLRSVAHLP